MRPASPYRRPSAIALVFAAWCAAYGLPAELVRDLTVQTVALSQFGGSALPGKQAKVLLDRLSTRVRRAEQVHLAFFDPFLAPTTVIPAPCSFAQRTAAAAQRQTRPAVKTALFPRPPPVSFPV